MAKINPEEADLCCDSCEVHENLVKIVNETMPDETELYDLAELFKVFGDSTRIKILYALFERADEKENRCSTLLQMVMYGQSSHKDRSILKRIKKSIR